MSKTLISVENIEQFVCCGKLLMDSSKILTAGARDELSRRGVEVVYGEEGQTCCCHGSGVTAAQATSSLDVGQFDEEMLIGIAAIIRQHHGITDPDVLRKVTLETAAAIRKGA